VSCAREEESRLRSTGHVAMAGHLLCLARAHCRARILCGGSSSEDGGVHMWDLHSYMSLASFQVHDAPIEDMHVLPENGLLVTCSTDRTVRV